MSNEIFIEDGKRLTLEKYVPIASRTMSLIAEAAEDIDEIDNTFSVDDLSTLLNKVSTYMAGEFEIRCTSVDLYQVIYEPYGYNAIEYGAVGVNNGCVDILGDRQNRLWISEEAIVAFTDRKLYGAASALYIYLGYLMTCDEAFAVSQNISFEKILESCDEFPEGCIKHRTTLMRALADLQDAGLIEWNAETGTFELLHITPYDPIQKV